MKKLVKIKGEIKTITFRNAENWSVFIICNINEDISSSMSCTGILPSIVDINHVVVCEGQWIENKYGKQLKCTSIAPAPLDVDTDAGVVKLLTLLPGIGDKKAAGAVKELGSEMAWDTAQEYPSYLGISNYEKCLNVRSVAKGLISNYDATTFLLGLGLTENQTNKIIKRYGAAKAIKQVSEEPYALINDIDGFGFRIVDGIGLKAGVKSNSDQRILACILFCIDDSEKNNGNVWFYGKKLVSIVIEELTESAKKQDVPIGNFDYGHVKKLVYRLSSGDKPRVYIQEGKVYSRILLDAEKTILNCFKREGSYGI